MTMRQLCRPGHAHNTARRPAQNRVLALENMCIGEATRRLHEEQLYARHLAGHLLHVAAQDGRQVGIHHGRIAPADKLHHRAGFMRAADLREPNVLRNAFGRLFMRRVAVTVHKNDGNTA